MSSKIPNYMRTHRKRWGLTQKELARLIGVKSGTQVSRYERLLRKPKLHIALACQVIFGELPHRVFPKHFEKVEEGVIERGYELYQELENSETKTAKRKLVLLSDMLRRATGRVNNDKL